MTIEEIISSLSTVYHALNNTSVSGRQNVLNISGSLTVLDEVLTALRKKAEEQTKKE